MAEATAASSSVSPGGVWQPQNPFDQGRRVTESLRMSLPLLPHPQAVSSPFEGMGHPALVRGDREVLPGREIEAFQKHWVAVPSTGRCIKNSSLLMHP